MLAFGSEMVRQKQKAQAWWACALINLYTYYTTLEAVNGTWTCLYFINENKQLQLRVDVLGLTRFQGRRRPESGPFPINIDINVKGSGQGCRST
jgi:hypothetical protein